MTQKAAGLCPPRGRVIPGSLIDALASWEAPPPTRKWVD